MQGILVGIHAFGELNAVGVDTCLDELFRQSGRRLLTGGVPVISDQHPFGFVLFEGGQQFIGEAVDAVARRDVTVTSRPEGQGIDQGFTQDNFLVVRQRFEIEHALMWPRQIQVIDRALAQVVVEFAAVQFQHLVVIHHRDHQRTVEVFMATFAQDAQGLQAPTDFSTGLAVLLRQTIRQRSVRHA